jgi:hypothetical protein
VFVCVYAHVCVCVAVRALSCCCFSLPFILTRCCRQQEKKLFISHFSFLICILGQACSRFNFTRPMCYQTTTLFLRLLLCERLFVGLSHKRLPGSSHFPCHFFAFPCRLWRTDGSTSLHPKGRAHQVIKRTSCSPSKFQYI